MADYFIGKRYPLFAPKPEHADKVAQWENLAAKHGVTLLAVAIAFGALPRCVGKVVMGVRSTDELQKNMVGMAEVVPPELWREAQADGLLRAELVLP